MTLGSKRSTFQITFWGCFSSQVRSLIHEPEERTEKMARFNPIGLSLYFVGLLSGGVVGLLPPSCNRIECPSYDLIGTGNGYEIRRYNSAVWISTSAIEDISLVDATRTGFLQLFGYIQGKNSYNEKIKMTAPVLTQVKPSDGPFCESSFVVSFYVPRKNQPDPPPAKGLHVHKWVPTYAAVGQFSGFVKDSDVGVEAAALKASLEGSAWSTAIEKSQANTTTYMVAQYNSPFEFDHRVNEVWMTFSIEKVGAI